jgi:hypothetical protein
MGQAQSHPANSLLRYSSPAIGDFDNDGMQDLLLGGADTWVKFYSNIGSSALDTFQLTNENFFGVLKLNIVPGEIRPRLTPAAADISQDGKPEIVLGINTGGLQLYSQDLADTNDLAVQYQFINDQITAYPNPASEKIVLKWNQAFEGVDDILLTLSDIVGRAVIQRPIPNNGQFTMDLPGLSPGIYNATLQQGKRLGTIRFVKY